MYDAIGNFCRPTHELIWWLACISNLLLVCTHQILYMILWSYDSNYYCRQILCAQKGKKLLLWLFVTLTSVKILMTISKKKSIFHCSSLTKFLRLNSPKVAERGGGDPLTLIKEVALHLDSFPEDRGAGFHMLVLSLCQRLDKSFYDWQLIYNGCFYKMTGSNYEITLSMYINKRKFGCMCLT